METALAAQTAEDLRLVTHVTAAKFVANRRTLAQGVVMPATKSHVSAPVPTASNLTAYAARTAKNILAHANNRQNEENEEQDVCCQKGRQFQCDCCMTCQQSTTKCLCSSMCYQQVHGCCKNCRDRDCGVCCPRCQETKNDCKCIPKVQKTARTPELKTSAAMTSADISILRDCSQLDFYTPAHAYNQAQELCKEMSNHFDNSVERNNKGAEKTVTWPKAKFGTN